MKNNNFNVLNYKTKNNKNTDLNNNNYLSSIDINQAWTGAELINDIDKRIIPFFNTPIVLKKINLAKTQPLSSKSKNESSPFGSGLNSKTDSEDKLLTKQSLTLGKKSLFNKIISYNKKILNFTKKINKYDLNLNNSFLNKNNLDHSSTIKYNMSSSSISSDNANFYSKFLGLGTDNFFLSLRNDDYLKLKIRLYRIIFVIKKLIPKLKKGIDSKNNGLNNLNTDYFNSSLTYYNTSSPLSNEGLVSNKENKNKSQLKRYRSEGKKRIKGRNVARILNIYANSLPYINKDILNSKSQSIYYPIFSVVDDYSYQNQQIALFLPKRKLKPLNYLLYKHLFFLSRFNNNNSPLSNEGLESKSNITKPNNYNKNSINKYKLINSSILSNSSLVDSGRNDILNSSISSTNPDIGSIVNAKERSNKNKFESLIIKKNNIEIKYLLINLKKMYQEIDKLILKQKLLIKNIKDKKIFDLIISEFSVYEEYLKRIKELKIRKIPLLKLYEDISSSEAFESISIYNNNKNNIKDNITTQQNLKEEEGNSTIQVNNKNIPTNSNLIVPSIYLSESLYSDLKISKLKSVITEADKGYTSSDTDKNTVNSKFGALNLPDNINFFWYMPNFFNLVSNTLNYDSSLDNNQINELVISSNNVNNKKSVNDHSNTYELNNKDISSFYKKTEDNLEGFELDYKDYLFKLLPFVSYVNNESYFLSPTYIKDTESKVLKNISVDAAAAAAATQPEKKGNLIIAQGLPNKENKIKMEETMKAILSDYTLDEGKFWLNSLIKSNNVTYELNNSNPKTGRNINFVRSLSNLDNLRKKVQINLNYNLNLFGKFSEQIGSDKMKTNINFNWRKNTVLPSSITSNNLINFISDKDSEKLVNNNDGLMGQAPVDLFYYNKNNNIKPNLKIDHKNFDVVSANELNLINDKDLFNKTDNLYKNNNNNNLNTGLFSKKQPIISKYLKDMSIFNMNFKGTRYPSGGLVYFSNIIGYKFNDVSSTKTRWANIDNNKNIYKFLSASFKAIFCLISKPVFVIKTDKIIIQLFYFLMIPNLLKSYKKKNYNLNFKWFNKKIRKFQNRNLLFKINNKNNYSVVKQRKNRVDNLLSSYDSLHQYETVVNNSSDIVFNNSNFNNSIQPTLSLRENGDTTLNSSINFKENSLSKLYQEPQLTNKNNNLNGVMISSKTKLNNINNKTMNNRKELLDRLNIRNRLRFLYKDGFVHSLSPNLNKWFFNVANLVSLQKDPVKKSLYANLINNNNNNNKRFLKNKLKKKFYLTIWDYKRKRLINKFKDIKINKKIKLIKLSKVSLINLYPQKFNIICNVLSKFFNKNIELDLIRIHYPYNDSNILVNLFAIMINKIKFRRITRKLFRKIVIRSISKMFINQNRKPGFNFIPAFLTGIKIKIGGRLMNVSRKTRKTVNLIERGSSSPGKVNYTDFARFTNKNKRGAYSITISSGQNFF